jgi:hypothetical protein
MLFFKNVFPCGVTQMTFQRGMTFPLSIGCIILITIATMLILVMAGTSPFNAHPDEHLHFKAAQYYMSYWFPPKVGDARSEYTYSYFGISYLDEPDIVYFLVGKFSEVLRFTGLSPYLLTRAFNAALFVALFLILLKYSLQIEIPLYGILLLSPQLWYIFSYLNGDAFGFFVGTFLILELSKLIRDPETTMPPIKIGLWLGLLVLAKRNYYTLIPLLAGVAVWHWIFFSKVGQGQILLKKWLMVALLAAIIALPKIVYQQWVNDFNLSEKRVAQMEKMAAPGFKPSEVTAPYSPWHVNIRAKGRPFLELLSTYDWHSISFKSMVGLYGWMNVLSPNWYYWVIFLLYMLLFGRLFLPSRPFVLSEVILTAIAIFGMAASCLASFINSWTVAFQAQGRYLFPVFCIFLLLMAYKWERLPQRFLYSVFLSTGLLSLWNFIFVGLAKIPR